MNAATLRVQAPFLFLAIANSFVDKTEDLQEKIFTKINETISKRIVMNGEKSLELLQGLIVILAWFHFHTESVHQLSLIRHISISLVGDLGLDRPPDHPADVGDRQLEDHQHEDDFPDQQGAKSTGRPRERRTTSSRGRFTTSA